MGIGALEGFVAHSGFTILGCSTGWGRMVYWSPVLESRFRTPMKRGGDAGGGPSSSPSSPFTGRTSGSQGSLCIELPQRKSFSLATKDARWVTDDAGVLHLKDKVLLLCIGIYTADFRPLALLSE